MSVWDPTTHLTVTEAELLEGQNVDEALMTKIGSNQEFSETQRQLQTNAWTKGSDVWDHFSEDLIEFDDAIFIGGSSHTSNSAQRLVHIIKNGASHDEDNHLMTMGAAGDDAIWTRQSRRADRVESILEARVKVSVFGATTLPKIGFGPSTSVGPTTSVDACWFEKGTNANTWKCLTRSGGSIRTTTDDQAGNYIGWDILKIEYLTAGCAFYINGTKVITHIIVLPDTVALGGFCLCNGSSGNLKSDWFSFRAIADSVSP